MNNNYHLMDFFAGQIQEPTWRPMEVIEKSTGKKISIKDFRFNPQIHERIGTGGGKVDLTKKPADEDKKEPVDEAPADMKFFQLKKYAKAKGVEVYKGMKKPELLAALKKLDK